ncbi:hypothetical protein ACQPZP_20435 [Spirillospora sp. CA-142024]|uniref:hypothetical protein n=1 Tax=Spirillospora sp. CA-142024 TaxID=3240036 RepID=UPI003D8B8BD0
MCGDDVRPGQGEADRDLPARPRNAEQPVWHLQPRDRCAADVDPYPDALARQALGALDDAPLHAALDRPDEATIADLVEASSLGTPAARALRARTTDEQARVVRERARQPDEEETR